MPSGQTPARDWRDRSFSAQLLELGLHHQVEGLVRRAEERMQQNRTPSTGNPAALHQAYEDAQNNYAENGLRLFSGRL